MHQIWVPSVPWSGKCWSVPSLQPGGQKSVTYWGLPLPTIHWPSVYQMPAAVCLPVGPDCPRSSGLGVGSLNSYCLSVVWRQTSCSLPYSCQSCCPNSFVNLVHYLYNINRKHDLIISLLHVKYMYYTNPTIKNSFLSNNR